LALRALSLCDRPAGPSPQPHLQHLHARVGQCYRVHISQPAHYRARMTWTPLTGACPLISSVSMTMGQHHFGLREDFAAENNFWRGTCKRCHHSPTIPMSVPDASEWTSFDFAMSHGCPEHAQHRVHYPPSAISQCRSCIYLLGRTRRKSDDFDSSSATAIARPFIGRCVGSAALLFLTGFLLPQVRATLAGFRKQEAWISSVLVVLILWQMKNTVKLDMLIYQWVPKHATRV
jgi:hypothetical protein